MLCTDQEIRQSAPPIKNPEAPPLTGTKFSLKSESGFNGGDLLEEVLIENTGSREERMRGGGHCSNSGLNHLTPNPD